MRKSFWIPCVIAVMGLLPVAPHVYAQTEEPVAVVAQLSRVNINQASADTLVRELSGIGPAKAQAIVDYRLAQGEFASVDELLEVKGIGVATLERNRERLAID